MIHKIRGEELRLLPEKCIFWSSERCLLMSDVHLGKVNHFRKNGFPLPHKAALDNYNRLVYLLHKLNPLRVLFLGDLFHSELNQDWLKFKGFIQAFPKISFELIKGNHDIISYPMLATYLDEVYEQPLSLGPFLLSHYPTTHSSLYNLCGHIHPAIQLKGKALQSLRLPCFFFSQHSGILPAFGTFTGSHTLNVKESDNVFLIADREIIRFS